MSTVRGRRSANPRKLRVIVAGHLRPVKDPFRTAMAVRRLPTESRIHVEHYGGVINESMRARAIAETAANDRYAWHGEVPRGSIKQKLASGWLMVLSSKMEGGANVLSEAIAHGIPVLASRIAGSTGLLGDDYDGFFEVGDTRALRRLLVRCEQEPDFHTRLRSQLEDRQKLFSRANELATWRELLGWSPFAPREKAHA